MFDFVLIALRNKTKEYWRGGENRCSLYLADGSQLRQGVAAVHKEGFSLLCSIRSEPDKY